MANISRFHREAPGSIPGPGIFFIVVWPFYLSIYLRYKYYDCGKYGNYRGTSIMSRQKYFVVATVRRIECN